MSSLLVEALSSQVLIFDGAMGTQLQAANLQNSDFVMPSGGFSKKILEISRQMGSRPLDGCNEILNFTRPDVIESVHNAYFEAGSDMVETNSFGSTSVVLAEYGIESLVYELNFEAAQIARRAADKASTPSHPKFVIGALGPGTKLISLGQVSWSDLIETYSTGFGALMDGGADGLLLETLQDLLMIKAGVMAAKKAMDERGKNLPLFVQFTVEQTGTLLLGSEVGAALNMLEAFPYVTAIGINCATGPVEMAPHIRFLGQNSTRPLSVQPNAGLPLMERGAAVYKLTPQELADAHEKFTAEHGVALAGGCCGTTPAHIRAVKALVGGKPHSGNAHWQKVQKVFPGFDFKMDSDQKAGALSLVGCSSLYQFQPYIQDNSLLYVGEKTNANGSRAFRDMLAKENWEGLTELAKEQELEGSHLLDVCTAYVGRDEVRDMTTLLASYNKAITIPIVIDSTEVPVIEAALKCVAGKPIVNSINFEDGGGRADKVLALCRDYGAGVVALTIDENGMAKSADQKFSIAMRLLDLTKSFNIPDHDVFIDALTFTLGSGDEEFRASAEETIKAIKLIKARYPRVNTTLGVSNVSFGLKPNIRQILNSVFLHYATEAGLTSAIVHVSKILPENKIEPDVWKLAKDLVYDKRVFETV